MSSTPEHASIRQLLAVVYADAASWIEMEVEGTRPRQMTTEAIVTQFPEFDPWTLKTVREELSAIRAAEAIVGRQRHEHPWLNAVIDSDWGRDDA